MIHTPAQGMVLARDAVHRGDDRVKAAFLEGFEMRGDADPNSPNGCAWRSAEEAWANSDTEGCSGIHCENWDYEPSGWMIPVLLILILAMWVLS